MENEQKLEEVKIKFSNSNHAHNNNLNKTTTTTTSISSNYVSNQFLKIKTKASED